jgi:hypothetical protein
MAEWLCNGLQIRPQRFDSASGLQRSKNANLAEILEVFPVTLAGADAVRDFAEWMQDEDLSEHVIECYRALAGGDAP